MEGPKRYISFNTTKKIIKENIIDRYSKYCTTEGCGICVRIQEDTTLPRGPTPFDKKQKAKQARERKKNKKKEPVCPLNCHCLKCQDKIIKKKCHLSYKTKIQRRTNEPPPPKITIDTSMCPLECYCEVHRKRTMQIRTENNRRGLPFPSSLTREELDYFDMTSLIIR
jgi:hypothetical protein